MGPKSHLYNALALAADIVIINVLMILTSIPIFTVGASIRAGNYVIAELIADEGAAPAKTYFQQFRLHMKTSTTWTLFMIFFSLLIAAEWFLLDAATVGQPPSFLFRVGLISGALIIAGVSMWLFYCEALHPQDFRSAFQHAAVSAIRFLPRTLAGLAMIAFPFVLLMVTPSSWFVILMFYVIIGWALTLYIFQLLVRGVAPHKK